MTPQYPPKHPGSFPKKLTFFIFSTLQKYTPIIQKIILPGNTADPLKNRKKSKNSKFLGMVRDALGGIGGSSLSIFTGFSKDFEKLNFRIFKIGRNRFKMALKMG